MQPGQTITPGQPPEHETSRSEQPPVTSAPVVPQEKTYSEPDQDTFQYTAEQVPTEAPKGEMVQWTASEYIDHAKGPMWFASMGLGLFILVTVVYLLLKDIFAAVLVGIAGITFGVFAGRRPQVLRYSISPQGISIGERTHPFDEFKSFSLTESGPLPAILLMPLKRFLPPLTIFYDPKEEDKIIEVLANYLPHEDRQPDVVDRLMSKIRF